MYGPERLEGDRGWPLLSATEINGDSKSTNEGVPPWLFRKCLSCRDKSAQYKQFFSSPYIISISLSTSHFKLGRQSHWIACLLVCVSGGDRQTGFLTNICYLLDIRAKFHLCRCKSAQSTLKVQILYNKSFVRSIESKLWVTFF
jgi:hypothetical protein